MTSTPGALCKPVVSAGLLDLCERPVQAATSNHSGVVA